LKGWSDGIFSVTSKVHRDLLPALYKLSHSLVGTSYSLKAQGLSRKNIFRRNKG